MIRGLGTDVGRTVAGLALAGWCLVAPLRAQITPASEDQAVRSFSIPDELYARTLFERAQGHAAAGRFGDAIADLQQVLEAHRGAVLGERPRDSKGRVSQQPVHPGAATSARDLLCELPPAGRKLYRDRFETTAQGALALATAAVDRAALGEVARRWPITLAAQQAWVRLGDLEFEMGDLDTALQAWSRAESLAQTLGDTLDLGAQRNALLNGDGRTAVASIQPDHGELELYDGGEPGGWLPGPDCHSWRQKISEESPEYPFNGPKPAYANNLFPVLVGDTVLVSTSLRLLAFNPYSGAPRWKSAEPPGWRDIDAHKVVDSESKTLNREDFFRGLNHEALMIAPAASGAIAVAALQIPITNLSNTSYQQIPITTVMPDRRLFAYDLETGAPLWQHMPPPMWDGESGSFEQRMRVGGPPVIRGARVLVPTYRLQGRYEFAVACYDLYTGALLWSTALISGQLELNMFGRQHKELCAPPLEVSGDRVIALTQLGAVAALDLFSGEILWETLYEQIPLPAAEGFSPSNRDEAWRNAPPVVADATVIAAPTDSRDLLGVDLAQGTLLWTKPQSRIAKGLARRDLMSLIGACDHTVYLAGGEIVALRAPTGLDNPRGPMDTSSSESLLAEYYTDQAHIPRALLCPDHVVVPTSQRRLALDRKNLHTTDARLSAPWGKDESPGNLVLGRGALYSLSGRSLTGMLDWESLEERLERELAADPKNSDLMLGFVDFLRNRAEYEQKGGRTARSLAYLERARGVLEPLASATASPRTALSERLHATLIAEADCLVDLADPGQALDRLQRSRAYATDSEAVRDTLLAIAALERERDPAAWLATVLELDRSCADLPMPSGAPATESNPRTVRTTAGDDLAAGRERPIEVGCWAQRELARTWQRTGDLERELDALHTLIARYGDVSLSPQGGPTAADRIGEIVAAGAPPEYAPWEARAKALLDEARAHGDLEELGRVGELYPHSLASREAQDSRLDFAYSAKDAGAYAAEALSLVPENWSIERASEIESRRLARVAHLFDLQGNVQLSDALLRALAAAFPDRKPELEPGATATFAQLAAALPPEPVATPPADSASFDLQAKQSVASPGPWSILGVVPPGSRAGADQPRVLICASTGLLRGYSSAEPQAALWSTRVDPRNDPELARDRVALAPQRVVVAASDALFALDATTGDEAWRVDLGDDSVESLTAADGLALVCVTRRDRSLALSAFDAHAGTPLWTRTLTAGTWPRAVVGAGRALVFSRGRATGSAQVIDLFSGRVAAELAFAASPNEAEVAAAWIQDRLCVLPSFPRAAGETAPMAQAFDLARGVEAWSIPTDPERELYAIARLGDASFWIQSGVSRGGRSSSGAILELDARLGAVRPVQGVHLAPGDLVIGVEPMTVVELPGPYLFLRSPVPGGRETLIRAIHLPYGERWTWRMPVAEESLYNNRMPLPALSRTCVALVYTETSRGRGRNPAGDPTTLVVLDRSSGQKRDTFTLNGKLGRQDRVELEAFGDALFIAAQNGRDGMEIRYP